MPDNTGHWLKVKCDVPNLAATSAVIEEGFNRLSSATVDIASNEEIPPAKVIGKKMTLTVDRENGGEQHFCGSCVSIEFLGNEGSHFSYRAELRSWFWFLSKTTNCRIFQEMSVIDIFDKVVKDTHGYSDYKKSLSGSYPKHNYVVQYRESDLDFLDRILTQEGVYFFSEMSDGKEELVLADSYAAHEAVDGEAGIKFRSVGEAHVGMEYISKWIRTHSVTSGNFVLDDYNFEKPKSDLQVKSKNEGDHDKSDYEQYDYPGHYRETSDGKELVKHRMKAETFQHHKVKAEGYITNPKAGRLFALEDYPLSSENKEYLIFKSRQHLRQDIWAQSTPDRQHDTEIEAIPSDVDYCAPSAAPWPEISGIHTATVVGKAGEEIWTDKHGRVKVQFHWDREGKSDENSSCWVRCMMPWTGKSWGMIHIPRIGQEVVVQFEEGNPDRPLIVGMLFNADTMPPYKLPDNQTQSGFTTRSTKSGSADTYHELMFEDKKDKELVRFQSERDYKQIVKNNAEIEIGLEHKDKGDLKQTVHNDKEVIIKEGDLKTMVEKGDQENTVKVGSKKQTIGKDYNLTVKGKQTEKITQSLTVEANQKIELKCGGSSIVMQPGGVTIKAPMITVQSQGMMTAKSSGVMTIQGALVTINP